jgi:hypothetical protein
MTPGSVDNADNTDQAGRTPHFRKLEAEQNMIALKKSLQMSGMKINAALYDSPMSMVSQGSENVHPNKLPAGNRLAPGTPLTACNMLCNTRCFAASHSSHKTGLSSNSMTKKALMVAAQQKSLWSTTPGFEVRSNTPPVLPPATPAAAPIPPPAASRPFAPPTPYVFEKPVATVTFSDSIGGPLATELPISAISTPMSQESMASLTPQSLMSLRSAPAMPLHSPALDAEKPQQASPDKLYALLMGVGSPSTDSVHPCDNTTESSLHSAEHSHMSFASLGMDPAVLVASAHSSPVSAEQASQHTSVRSPLPSPMPTDMSQVTVSPMTLSMFVQQANRSPQQQSAAVSMATSPAAVAELSAHETAPRSMSTPESARPSPVVSSAASTAHSLASSAGPMTSPIAHFQYGLSPTVAEKPPRMPSPVQHTHATSPAVQPSAQASPVAIAAAAAASPAPVPSASSAQVSCVSTAHSSPAVSVHAIAVEQRSPAPAQMHASPDASVGFAAHASPAVEFVAAPVAQVSPSPSVAFTAASCSAPINVAVTPAAKMPSPAVPRSTPQQDTESHYVLSPAQPIAQVAPVAAQSPLLFAFAPLPPMPPTPVDDISFAQSLNSTCNTSLSSLSSTASPAVLCRRGGVAFGHGPRAVSKGGRSAIMSAPVRGIAIEPVASSRVVRSPVAKVSVNTSVGSAAKPALPRHEAASKVGRKQHPTVSRSHTKSSAAKVQASPAKAPVPKQSSHQHVSGVSRAAKRAAGDTEACDASTSYAALSSVVSMCDASTSYTPLNSTASVCFAEETAANLTSLVSQCSAHSDNVTEISAAMCNVSIQCDSFQIAAGQVVQPPTPSQASIHQLTPLVGRSAYDCFEDGLDGAMSVDGSQVHQSATLDYSVDTPEAAHHTPPQDHRASPVFMSYRKLHHDSDSEDDMAEMGLQELLAGTPQPASPIAKRHSFEDSSCMHMALVPRKVEWEHSFVAPSAAPHRTVTPGSVGTASSCKSKFTPRTVSSHKSALGSAKRVTPSGEVEVHVVYTANEQEQDETSRSESANHAQQWQHSVDFSAAHDRAMLEMSALTDKAVIPANLSSAESVIASHAVDMSESQSQATGAETTLTLDHKHRLDISAGSRRAAEDASALDAAGPRLAFMHLRRDHTAPEDVKEITFDARPGEATTVELTIANHRDKSIRLHGHTVSLRFEEYASRSTGLLALPEGQDDDGLTVESAAPPCSFEVSPAELKIPAGQEGTLYVTFAPQEGVAGVYSGALKMRSKTKVPILPPYYSMRGY